MRKHQIENICWEELSWQRDFTIEAVWEVLSHLAALSPRGAVIWEARGKNGRVRHLLGADRAYIGSIMEVFKAHGKTSFHDVPGDNRLPVATARQLRITHPALSLKTDITEAVIRAGLAALIEDKSGVETVMQVVLGRAYAPSPVPADLADPTASWLSVILGSISKATAESRKSVREKAEQYSFQAAVRVGVSEKDSFSRLQSMVSAMRVLESAGVHIHAETCKPSDLNAVHVPWHFPLRLSVKELANFLLLPTGDKELPGIPGLHPRLTLPPTWYKSPTSKANDRSFAKTLDGVSPKKLSISPGTAWSTPFS